MFSHLVGPYAFVRDWDLFVGIQRSLSDFVRSRLLPVESYPKARFEDLSVGKKFERSTRVEFWMVVLFGLASGDMNPLHFVREFAAKTIFKEPIAHGLLTAGLLSAVLGNDLPGPGAVYISQDLQFKRPVKIGDTVISRVQVISLDSEKRQATLECTSLVGDKEVLKGTAVVWIPK